MLLVEGTDFATVDVEDSDNSDDEVGPEDAFMQDGWVLVNWKKRRPKFSHDCVCVERLLSPNPSTKHAVKTTAMQAD